MKKRNKVVLTVILILVMAGGMYLWKTREQGLDIDGNAKKYEVNIKEPEDWGNNRIAVPGYGDIEMEEGSDRFCVALYNPKENPCYFVFSVMVEGKEQYRSKLVPPGEAITNARLSEKIAGGIHEVTIKIETYDLADGKTPMNGSEVKTRIIASKQ